MGQQGSSKLIWVALGAVVAVVAAMIGPVIAVGVLVMSLTSAGSWDIEEFITDAFESCTTLRKVRVCMYGHPHGKRESVRTKS